MRNTDESVVHYITLALCLSLTLECITQEASAEAQRRPQVVRVSGPILKAISVASERFLKEEERREKESQLGKSDPANVPLQCISEIQSYDVAVREDRTSYVVEFHLNSRCPIATGGGAEVVLRKADLAVMDIK